MSENNGVTAENHDTPAENLDLRAPEQPAEPEAPRKVIAVIDGNSLMHRAYHGVPPTMNAPDGRPTNAVFGFLNMFLKLVDAFHPDGIVCAFDRGKPAVRMEMLPQYKAQRKPMDDELRVQFPMIHDLLAALNVPVVESEGWEGDDILGTLGVSGEAAGCDMLLVTGDRDIYQLATDHIKIVGTRRGLSDVKIVTPEEVIEAYNGVTADLIPDFYGLKGDSSDNIPGVPGIGPKKAAALITQYGDLEGVIAHADEVKGKTGENLRAHIEDARISKKVATIRTDAPVSCDFAAVAFPDFDEALVRGAFSQLGITTLMARFLALDEQDGSAPSSAGRLELPELVEGEAALAELARAVGAGEWVSCVIDDDREEGALFGTTHVLWAATSEKLLRIDRGIDGALAMLVREGRIVSPDVKALVHELVPVDSSEPALIDPMDVDPARIFDTTVAAYLLDSSRSSFDAEYFAEKYAGVMLPEVADAVGKSEASSGPAPAPTAAAVSCVLAGTIRERMEQALDEDGSRSCFDKIEMPLVPVLVLMERNGMYVDPERLAEQAGALGDDIAVLEARIQELAGESFNVGSPMQLSHILFDVMGLPTAGLKKTQRGYYSTNARVLEELARDHEIVRLILEYREKSKIKSTYLDTLGGLRATDGRVHTTYNQTVTATGRLSSSNPNLQNIPTRSELGRHVRQAFSAAEGSVILAIDYSQIELRLLAHLSGDEHLVAAFCEGEDFHAETASRVFGVPVAEVTPQLRSRAKAVNFGIVYGQQAYGLSQSLGIPMGEARAMIDRYFEVYPGVRRYLDQTVADARRTGYASTMFGRKRHIPELKLKNPAQRGFGERTAMNHPMQGTAADIIKLAMVDVARKMREQGFRARMILQVHDELDFECPLDEVEALTSMVRDAMEGVVELKVPLIADASTGVTWAEAK